MNARRSDGFTPLHLAAARFTAHDRQSGLISLEEPTQMAILKTLLDHGADRTMTVSWEKAKKSLRVHFF